MARAALVALCASCLVAVAHAGAGANEPIDPNELGLTSTDCAQQYCTSKVRTAEPLPDGAARRRALPPFPRPHYRRRATPA